MALLDFFRPRPDGRAGAMTPPAAASTSPGKQRVAVILLTLSTSGFTAWKAYEGFTGHAIIPTKGDVPTIGYGNTYYEDGTRVRMGDTITRQRADQLAKNILSQKERAFRATIPGVALTQGEYDVYIDYTGQYGLGNWRKSSMRRELITGNYVGACRALLNWRFAGGYDCSTLVNGQPNKRCWGVWTRQLERNRKCMEAQP